MRISQTLLYAMALASQAVAGRLGAPTAPHISPEEGDPSDDGPKILVPRSTSPTPLNVTSNGTTTFGEKNNAANNTTPFPKHLKELGVLPPLPVNASEAALKFQPVVDFDKESCYNTAAIDIFGNCSEGREDARCREKDMLRPEYNNVYVRRRCNHSWCAWMYEYYFANDYSWRRLYGWRQKWDTVVVWTENTSVNNKEKKSEKLQEWTPRFVSVSYAAKEFEVFKVEDIVFDGTHPMVLYQKTIPYHRFNRIWPDNEEGDDGPNYSKHTLINKLGQWVKGSLVEYGGFPAGVRSGLTHYFWSSDKERKLEEAQRMKMVDSDLFKTYLERALPKEIWGIFNVNYDDYPWIPESR